MLLLVSTASATTYTVTNIADSGAGSLRQALANAAAQAGEDTIVFDSAMSGQTITLTNEIAVNDASGVTIDASSLPDGLSISGNNITRMFSQGNTSTLTLRGLSLINGRDVSVSGAISNLGTLTLVQCSLSNNSVGNAGGAIGSFGSLTLVQCTLVNNSARYAGAINAEGSLTLTQCTLSGNATTENEGGAIYLNSGCTAVLTDCTFSENTASSNGGAIYAYRDSMLGLTQCTFFKNSARSGGAIYSGGERVALTECTLSGNSSRGSGGAISNSGTLTLTRCTAFGNFTIDGYGGAISNSSGSRAMTLVQCTFYGNVAGSKGTVGGDPSGCGGAISTSGVGFVTQCTVFGNTTEGNGGGIFHSYFSTLTLSNCIVAGNKAPAGADIYHRFPFDPIIRAGANLIGSNDTITATFPVGTPNANGDYVGTSTALLDPQLAPLANNGGATRTMALLPGSIARNHGAILSPAITSDQRGRPIIDSPDIGAYENQFGVLKRPLLIPFGTSSISVLCNLETDGEVSISSNNTSVVPDAGIVFTGNGLSRTITITPSGQIGSATLTLTHSPSQETDTLEVYVLPENYVAASINDIRDEIINEDAGTVVIPFTVTDAASAFGLTISATSSNPKLVPNGSIILSGTGANRSLHVTPAADQSGAAIITVTVSDGATTASDTFLLTINSVNDAPSFTKGGDLVSSSEVGAQSVSRWASDFSKGPPDESDQQLSFLVENDNSAFFTVQPAISSDGTLTYTPVPGAEGTVTVSVRVQDNGGTDNGGVNTSAAQTFTITLVSARTPTVVTSTADSGPGTLRQIVAVAGAKPGTDVITFAPELSGQTITLASQILVRDTSGVIVDASALPGGLTISGNNVTRIFIQPSTLPNPPPSRLTLRGLSLVNGYSESAGGAISNSGTLTLEQCILTQNSGSGGGAINNAGGTLMMMQCTVSENTARGGSGGAIYISDKNTTAVLTQCTLSDNKTTNNGGAITSISSTSGSTLSLTQCALSRNSALNGGAVYTSNALNSNQCTFSENSAERDGGAIHNSSTLTSTQCTFAGNSAKFSGGAIYNMSTLKLTHCTLSGNGAGSGGGIFNQGILTFTNSILAGNTASYGPDLHSSPFSFSRFGANLIGKNNTYFSNIPAGTPNTRGDYVGTDTAPLDPQLAPLGHYGGPTQTMALLPNSLARNRATILSPAITVDQRGFPIVGKPDIGTYETGTTNTFALWGIENSGVALSFAADTDHDGLSDGLEYATRSSLSVTDVNPLATPLSAVGSGMQLSFPYRAGAKDLRYIVQRSTDLSSWTEVYRYDASQGLVNEGDVAAEEDPVTQIITIVDHASASSSASFWRLLVELVP